jgi:hypothetical protein
MPRIYSTEDNTMSEGDSEWLLAELTAIWPIMSTRHSYAFPSSSNGARLAERA